MLFFIATWIIRPLQENFNKKKIILIRHNILNVLEDDHRKFAQATPVLTLIDRETQGGNG